MLAIADLRNEYSKASLDVTNVLPDPVRQFEKWFQEAVQAQVPEPNAMTLSTVNALGGPSSRIVLLKGIESNRFVFYTNYQSAKGKDLERVPACALTFFWPELERQVRIEGVAGRIDAERSEQYFQSRPRGSQIGAWSSPQSSIIESRTILEERVAQIEKKFSGHEVLPKPHQWGGFEVEPVMIEFWQGRQSRLHDRIQFSKIDNAWKIYRLAP
ncbi:MAG TPA: pyridoxamine 5'-phosphate oxidase [Ohtaekwangia sp.]|uniref:pyridoxamine 5'-phosphate oxidase n=1 Tax=Ohtaekwangia sp. TaxID=2066019 RepID=UPI002F93A548